MANLPLLSSGFLTMRPATFSHEFVTDSVTFMDDSEQRWVARVSYAAFSLTYTNVEGYDVNVMLDFFQTHKGRLIDDGLSNTFSITAAEVPGQPYNFCYFDQDDFSAQEIIPNRYSFVLKIRQARAN